MPHLGLSFSFNFRLLVFWLLGACCAVASDGCREFNRNTVMDRVRQYSKRDAIEDIISRQFPADWYSICNTQANSKNFHPAKPPHNFSTLVKGAPKLVNPTNPTDPTNPMPSNFASSSSPNKMPISLPKNSLSYNQGEWKNGICFASSYTCTDYWTCCSHRFGTAMSQTKEFLENVTQVQCIIEGGVKGMLEGGVNWQGEGQFVGLVRLNESMYQLMDGIEESRERIRKLKKSVAKLEQYSKHILTEISRIDMASQQKQFLQYKKPISVSVMYAYYLKTNFTYIPSTFIPILGNTTIKNTLVYNLSSTLTNILSSISIITNVFQTTLSSSIISRPDLQKVESQIHNTDKLQQDIHSLLQTITRGALKKYTSGVYVIGVIVILVSIGVGTLVGINLWGKRKGRRRGWGIGWKIGVGIGVAVVWGLGFVHFGVGFGYLIGNPAALYSCQFLRQSFSSQIKFKQNILSLQPQNKYLQTISKCLKSSETSTSYIESLLPNNSLTTLSSAVSGSSSSLNPKLITSPPQLPIDSSAPLSNSHLALLTQVSNYLQSKKFDIADPQIILQFENVAKVLPCIPDSWVPSLQQISPIKIGCQYINNTSTSTGAPYAINSSADWKDVGNAGTSCRKLEDLIDPASQRCRGCMDTASFVQLFNIASQYQQFLIARYRSCYQKTNSSTPQTQQNPLLINFPSPSPSRSQQKINQLSTIFEQYYLKKNKNLGPVIQIVQGVKGYVKECADILDKVLRVYRGCVTWMKGNWVVGVMGLRDLGVLNQIVNTKENNNTLTILQQSPTAPPTKPSSPSPSPSCRFLGATLQLSTNLLCSKTIPYVYYMRYYYGALGGIIFGLLLALIGGIVWGNGESQGEGSEGDGGNGEGNGENGGFQFVGTVGSEVKEGESNQNDKFRNTGQFALDSDRISKLDDNLPQSCQRFMRSPQNNKTVNIQAQNDLKYEQATNPTKILNRKQMNQLNKSNEDCGELEKRSKEAKKAIQRRRKMKRQRERQREREKEREKEIQRKKSGQIEKTGQGSGNHYSYQKSKSSGEKSIDYGNQNENEIDIEYIEEQEKSLEKEEEKDKVKDQAYSKKGKQ